MSPEDLAAVDRSWAQLRRRRGALLAELESCFCGAGPPEVASVRARWLVDAVEELAGLLPAPSRLERRARALACTWPIPGTAATFGVDGRAWMTSAQRVLPEWSDRTELAWRHAWLLVAAVLADEALSPFAAPTSGDARR